MGSRNMDMATMPSNERKGPYFSPLQHPPPFHNSGKFKYYPTSAHVPPRGVIYAIECHCCNFTLVKLSTLVTAELPKTNAPSTDKTDHIPLLHISYNMDVMQ